MTNTLLNQSFLIYLFNLIINIHLPPVKGGLQVDVKDNNIVIKSIFFMLRTL